MDRVDPYNNPEGDIGLGADTYTPVSSPQSSTIQCTFDNLAASAGQTLLLSGSFLKISTPSLIIMTLSGYMGFCNLAGSIAEVQLILNSGNPIVQDLRQQEATNLAVGQWVPVGLTCVHYVPATTTGIPAPAWLVNYSTLGGGNNLYLKCVLDLIAIPSQLIQGIT